MAATVTARLASAPSSLASQLRLSCTVDDDESAEEVSPPPEVQLSVTPGRGAQVSTCSARAETEAGGVMLTADLEIPVRGGRVRRIWPWLVGAGGAVLVAVLTAVIVVAAQPDDAYIGGPSVEGW